MCVCVCAGEGSGGESSCLDGCPNREVEMINTKAMVISVSSGGGGSKVCPGENVLATPVYECGGVIKGPVKVRDNGQPVIKKEYR